MWRSTSSGAVATDPREFDLYYLCPDDGPTSWWKFWYGDREADGGYRKAWPEFVRWGWVDVDATVVDVPIEAKAIFLQCMIDITYAGTGIAEIWLNVRAPSAKDNVLTDFTGRHYGDRTFRTICTEGGTREAQSTWVAIEDGKFSVRADYNGHGAYPAIPAYMARISAAAYVL